MRTIHWVLSGLLLVATAQSGLAKCGDNPGDDQAVADARAQAEIDCPCASFTNHGQYVKCVGGVAKARSETDPPLLPKNCKGKVRSCAARSTCGKPDFVRCCVTRNSETKCKMVKGNAKCTMMGGEPFGVGSCCDQCGAGSSSGAFLERGAF
jgi:hypothetical protein